MKKKKKKTQGIETNCSISVATTSEKIMKFRKGEGEMSTLIFSKVLPDLSSSVIILNHSNEKIQFLHSDSEYKHQSN